VGRRVRRRAFATTSHQWSQDLYHQNEDQPQCVYLEPVRAIQAYSFRSSNTMLLPPAPNALMIGMGTVKPPNANVQTYVPSQIGAVGNKIWAGCRVNVGECPNFPQYSKQDVYETQPTVAACSQRVSDYVYWCQSPGNGSGYTYSQFWSNGNYLGEKIGYGPTFRYVSGSFSGPPSLPTCAASSCNWSTLNSTCYSASLRRNPSTGQNETLYVTNSCVAVTIL
jgi:hypothetical protein